MFFQIILMGNTGRCRTVKHIIKFPINVQPSITNPSEDQNIYYIS